VTAHCTPLQPKGDCAVLDFDELQALIRLFEATGLTEMEIEEGGKRVRLTRAPVAETYPVSPRASRDSTLSPAVPASQTYDTELFLAEGLVTVDSPLTGIYYASSGPGAPPFIQVGDTVDANQVVCIVEARNSMNEVTSKVPAIVERILVRNCASVVYGQPLIAIRPLA